MKLTEETLALMTELTEAIGVSGQEKQVTRILRRCYEKYCDEVVYDNLGSVYGVKRSAVPGAFRVMVSAHCDEVGLLVNGVTPNGFLMLAAVGGVQEEMLLGTPVTLVNHDGQQFPGCITSYRPPRWLAPAPDKHKLEDLLCDIGFASEAEVRAHGIMEGDMIAFRQPLTVLGDGKRIMAKAWDNRIGCVLGINLLETLRDAQLPFDLYVGANVQEEVGLNGAVTAANMIHPDLAVVLDCSGISDVKGSTPPAGGLGKGAPVRFLDRNYLVNRAMLRDYLTLLQQHGLPYQMFRASGGTDAGTMQLSYDGLPILTCCVCGRNVHTNVSIIDVDDYLAVRQGLCAFVGQLDVARLKAYRESNR